MSAAIAAIPPSAHGATFWWKKAGISYLNYANLCAAYSRRAFKDPYKSKALEREAPVTRIEFIKNGKVFDVKTFDASLPKEYRLE